MLNGTGGMVFFGVTDKGNPAQTTLFDFMQEAVEICKLRLFLKLVAQVDKAKHLEPLPDIDFNVRAGNTLVGFGTLDDVKNTLDGKLAFHKGQVDRIVEEAAVVERAFQRFHEMQTKFEMDAKEFAEQKTLVRAWLKKLTDELDKYLAVEYGVDPEKDNKFMDWRAKYQPFHWLIEFYGIVNKGGFNIIIGNLPYVELSKVRGTYKLMGFATESCGNLYCPMMERSSSLLQKNGFLGKIVPLSVVCTDRMSVLREFLESTKRKIWCSHFSGDANPSKLFEGVKSRFDIVLMGQSASKTELYSSPYMKWFADERKMLFDKYG